MTEKKISKLNPGDVIEVKMKSGHWHNGIFEHEDDEKDGFLFMRDYICGPTKLANSSIELRQRASKKILNEKENIKIFK